MKIITIGFILFIFCGAVLITIPEIKEDSKALEFCKNKGYEGVDEFDEGILHPKQKYRCYKYDEDGFLEYSGLREYGDWDEKNNFVNMFVMVG